MAGHLFDSTLIAYHNYAREFERKLQLSLTLAFIRVGCLKNTLWQELRDLILSQSGELERIE